MQIITDVDVLKSQVPANPSELKNTHNVIIKPATSKRIHNASTKSDSDVNQTPTHSTDKYKIVSDLNRRKKNIVVSGLPENTSLYDTEQTCANSDAFIQLCESNLPVKPVVSGCRRLGKHTGGIQPRKLLP